MIRDWVDQRSAVMPSSKYWMFSNAKTRSSKHCNIPVQKQYFTNSYKVSVNLQKYRWAWAWMESPLYGTVTRSMLEGCNIISGWSKWREKLNGPTDISKYSLFNISTPFNSHFVIPLWKNSPSDERGAHTKLRNHLNDRSGEAILLIENGLQLQSDAGFCERSSNNWWREPEVEDELVTL